MLRIGTAFALTGDGKLRGAAEVAGVELAVRELNTAGGVNGALVEVHHRDGTSPAEAFAALAERQVDVIIGPDSTAAAEDLIPLSADAGIPLISASAPTGDGVMSFSLVATGTAEDGLVARLEGSILSVGTDLAAAAEPAGLEHLGAVEITPGQTDFSALIAEASAADQIVIGTNGDLVAETSSAIEALLAAGIAPSRLWFTGEALRSWPDLPEGALADAHGYRPGTVVDAATEKLLRTSDPGLRETGSAAEAHDAVVLAALAATMAADDGGPSIASRLRAAAGQGIHCASFGECLAVLADGQDIDYTGLSDIDLGDEGAPVTPTGTIYRYTGENRPAREVE